ncbi:hypothetical protein HZS_3608 [Henneguya salminicola]|nr:hypothetical protein HZS_3608 [Henneguya salminicola]
MSPSESEEESQFQAIEPSASDNVTKEAYLYLDYCYQIRERMKSMAKKMNIPLEYLGICPIDPEEIPKGPENPLIRRNRTPTPERLKRKLKGQDEKNYYSPPKRPIQFNHKYDICEDHGDSKPNKSLKARHRRSRSRSLNKR